jgi:hypothetical protein
VSYKPTAKLYTDAAEVIRKQGHAKGTLGREHGPVCLLGALNVAAFGSATNWGAEVDLMDAWNLAGEQLAKHLPEKLSPAVATVPNLLNRIVTWNDEAERTPDDVINLFERAAKAQEEAKQ